MEEFIRESVVAVGVTWTARIDTELDDARARR